MKKILLLVLMLMSFVMFPFANESLGIQTGSSASATGMSQATKHTSIAPDDELQEKITKLKTITKVQDGQRYVTSVIRFVSARTYQVVFTHKGGRGRIRVSLDDRCDIASPVREYGVVNLGGDSDKLYTDTVEIKTNGDGKYYIGFYNLDGLCPEITEISIIGRNRVEPEQPFYQVADVPLVVLPCAKQPNQNAAAAATVAYAQTPHRPNTEAEKIVYFHKERKEQERIKDEILDRAINSHPDPEVVRGIIESALTRGKVKSSFDTLTTHIDPIKGAENLKFKYGWIPPEAKFEPDLTPTYEVPAGNRNNPKFDYDSPYYDANSGKTSSSEEPASDDTVKSIKKTKKNPLPDNATNSGKYEDKLFKKGKVKDFSWSFIPFRKIALLTILIPLLVLVRRLKWGYDSMKSTIQNQKDRINAARIRQAIYNDEESEIPEVASLSPVEIAKNNRLLVAYASELASVAEFNNRISQQLEALSDETTRNATRRNLLLELNKKLVACNDTLIHVDYKTTFESVHVGFIGRLLSRYPQLSAADTTLCAYLYLGISTKEIASLTKREIRSVESMRNRLRKKLELESGTDFVSFFASI